MKNHQKTTQIVQEYKRLQCIYLVHKKYPKGEISEMFDVSHNKIATWAKLFQEEGFSGLLTINYHLRRKSKLLRFKDEIKEYVDKELPGKVSHIQDWLENTHNILLSIAGSIIAVRLIFESIANLRLQNNYQV